MFQVSKAAVTSAFLVTSYFAVFTPAKADKGGLKGDTGKVGAAIPVLWQNPVDITSRNLFYGPGGKAHEPRGPFTFEREDSAGTNPKFDVVDADGVKWRVKLGEEAGPETVASRLVWSVGYFANEEYFLPVIQVQKMQRLHRGNSHVSPDGTILRVRMKRHMPEEKKLGTWSWSKSPFKDSQEWYGLRVLMAVLNNWDLKDRNNSIYLTRESPPVERYVVSDLGASFGPTGLNGATKGDPSAYCDSKWIKQVSGEFVDFHVPSPPAMQHYINIPEMTLRLRLVWLGRHIPRAHARWIGQKLAQLSPQQIRDAFRAGGYSAQDVERLSLVVERRIAELNKL